MKDIKLFIKYHHVDSDAWYRYMQHKPRIVQQIVLWWIK